MPEHIVQSFTSLPDEDAVSRLRLFQRVDTVVIGSVGKICIQCKESKLSNAFSKDKSKRDGLTSSCKECLAARGAKYYQTHREEIMARMKKYRQREEIKAGNAKYRRTHREEIKAQKKKYRQTHNEEIKARNLEYKKRRYMTYKGYRLRANLKRGMKFALNKTYKSASTMKLIGLESCVECLKYLYSKSPWFEGVPLKELTVDHIIPCARYDFEKPDHQKSSFHYTNLQLLRPEDNNVKSDKVPPRFNFESTLQKQLELIEHIERERFTHEQVLEFQKVGELYEVIGYKLESYNQRVLYS